MHTYVVSDKVICNLKMSVITAVLTVFLFGTTTPIEAGFLDAFSNAIDNSYSTKPIKASVSMPQINDNKDSMNSGFIDNMGTNYRRNPWLGLLPNQQRPIVNGFTQSTTTESTDGVDPEIAKRFPEGVKLLNELKELNKLKEEGKLFKKTKNENVKPDKNNHNNIKNTTESSKTGTENVNKNSVNSNNENYTKRKCYFQVQPVIPDNEKQTKEHNNTAYYVDCV